MRRFCILSTMFLFAAAAAYAGPVVSNVVASQRTDGTGLVDVYYTLSGASGPVRISVTFSNDNGQNWNVLPNPSLLSGDNGPDISNGNRHIVWDAPRDRHNVYWPNARARVSATDIDAATVTVMLPGGVPMEFVWIPSGSFLMGSASGDEAPVHTVNIDYDFHLGKFEVTQAQWQAVMVNFPTSQGTSNVNPVFGVSWNDSKNFVNTINSLGIGSFRLPSEAEWEYACRAGTDGLWSFGNNSALLGDYAWYSANNTPSGSKSVGMKLPNAFGLYDMHGNVSEWVKDWYHSSYTGAPTNGSAWEDPVGTLRVTRGGYYSIVATGCRSAHRSKHEPAFRNNTLGFRLIRYD